MVFYDIHADKFEKIPFKKALIPSFERYAPRAAGKNVLDIGSGPGAFALWMKEKGYTVLCIDPSEEMIERCKKKGLSTQKTNFQQFQSEGSYDIITAVSSLIHLPRNEQKAAFKKITSLLKEEGILFLSMILGDFEGELDPTQTGDQRYFCFIQEEELLNLVHDDYFILEKQKIHISKMDSDFLFLALQKKGMRKEIDAEQYRKHSHIQNKYAKGLLESYPFRGDENVLDLGCGDGSLTNEVAAKVPEGSVTGVDRSSSMLDLAKRSYPNIEFIKSDITLFQTEKRFDLITLFNVIHWIHDLDALFEKIKSVLQPNGSVLIVTYPLSSLHVPIVAVANREKWQEKFTAIPEKRAEHSLEDYSTSIYQSGFNFVDLREEHVKESFKGKEEFINQIKAYLIYLFVLPEQYHEEFLDETWEEVIKRNPPKEDGSLHFEVIKYLITVRNSD